MAYARSSLLIWGSGGYGRAIAELATAAGHHVLGLIGDDDAPSAMVGVPSVMSEEELHHWLSDDSSLPVCIDVIAAAAASNGVRLDQAHRLGGLLTPPLIHPDAVVSPSASLENGAIVKALAEIAAGATIGRAAVIGTGSVVGPDTLVQDGASLGAHVVLEMGACIGERAHIGAGAIVLPHVRIGADVVVGAGAVVQSDLPAGAGTVPPARMIMDRAPSGCLEES